MWIFPVGRSVEYATGEAMVVVIGNIPMEVDFEQVGSKMDVNIGWPATIFILHTGVQTGVHSDQRVDSWRVARVTWFRRHGPI